VELLRHEAPEFITPDIFPSNSSHLNLVDYRIWGVMQERIYANTGRGCSAAGVDHVGWFPTESSVVDEAIDQ